MAAGTGVLPVTKAPRGASGPVSWETGHTSHSGSLPPEGGCATQREVNLQNTQVFHAGEVHFGNPSNVIPVQVPGTEDSMASIADL